MENNSRLEVLRWMLARLTGEDPVETAGMPSESWDQPLVTEEHLELKAEVEPLGAEHEAPAAVAMPISIAPVLSASEQRLAILQGMLQRLTGEA